jgi:hypothetical protein
MNAKKLFNTLDCWDLWEICFNLWVWWDRISCDYFSILFKTKYRSTTSDLLG